MSERKEREGGKDGRREGGKEGRREGGKEGRWEGGKHREREHGRGLRGERVLQAGAGEGARGRARESGRGTRGRAGSVTAFDIRIHSGAQGSETKQESRCESERGEWDARGGDVRVRVRLCAKP